MTINRIQFAAGVFMALILAMRVGWAAPESDSSKFIQDLGSRVLAMYNDPRLTDDERETRLRAVTTKDFDVTFISQFVLGRHWKTATETERREFKAAFEHYIVHVYAALFHRYHDATFKVTSERATNTTRTLVHSEIKRRDRPAPVKVEWWVVTVDKTPKITDVNVDGVSQLLSLRDEFSAVIARNNGQVSALIDQLNQKIKE